MEKNNLPSLPLALLPIVLTLGLLATQLCRFWDFTPHFPLILGFAMMGIGAGSAY